MTDVNIDLVYGKKWRELEARGDDITVEPWVPYLSAMREIYGEAFKVSDWTKDHVRHWVMHQWPIYWGSASCGKALLPSEPVYFEDRVGTIGEVKPGDRIFAATGNLVRVRGVYRQQDMPLYRVRFSDGTETICAKDHLWTIRYRGRKRWTGPRSCRKPEMGWIVRTLPVDRIAGWSTLRSRRVSVPVVAPVRFSRKGELPLDPYVLGALLGDASMTATILFTSHPDDEAVRDEINVRIGRQYPGYGLSQVGGSDTSYMLVNLEGRKPRNPVVSALKKLGLYGHTAFDKFVPDMYRFSSVDDRFDLLAGLFDTDGTISRSGHATFTTVSRGLAYDVKFILQSLGVLATVTAKQTTYTAGGERRAGSTAYNVYVRTEDPEVLHRLFKLPRKRARVKTGYARASRRFIESVELIRNRGDFPRETVCITIEEKDDKGFATEGLFPVGEFVVTHNSNDTGACVLVDWMVDPRDTITLIGSTTKPMLQKRIWESILKYLGAFQDWSTRHGFVLPARVADAGFAILNARDAGDNAADMAVKAGIHGIALDEGGKLQGAHMPYVRVVIDELATIRDHQAVQDAITNLLVAKDFKFAAMANPDPWTDPSSSIYCTPIDGIDSVNVDTREWETTFGAHVLHDDGFKSPCVLHPELADEFPFLTQKKHLDIALKVAGGNADAPTFWRMARGFPTPSGAQSPVLLDPAIASRNRICEAAPPFDTSTWRATAAGIDPAWTEDGDGACRARCYVRIDPNTGRHYLDFTGGLSKFVIKASMLKTSPALEQLRDQAVAVARAPLEAPWKHTAVDSSGNQSLGAALIMYAGAYDIMQVDFGAKASEAPIMKFDPRVACDIVADRGTEAWTVLARFCEAGMVKGLPEEACRALTMRRYAVDVDRKTGVVSRKKGPDRLEPKKEFKPRFGHSPDEADACALAALVVKEVIGLSPFGFLERPVQRDSLVGQPAAPALPAVCDSSVYEARAEDEADNGYAYPID